MGTMNHQLQSTHTGDKSHVMVAPLLFTKVCIKRVIFMLLQQYTHEHTRAIRLLVDQVHWPTQYL